MKYNVIWMVVDCVRSYRSGIDNLDRLDIMDSLGKEAVEFTNAITSAPSSALSASAMFTGLPACIISRHFNDWKFDEKRIDSLQNVLKKNGYGVYAILDSREGRRMLQNLTHTISARYFPKGITHNNCWTNEELTNTLECLLDRAEQKSPGLYVLWYDGREGPATSKELSRALGLFKKHGLYDNSIIVICSDHGYPDPSTGLTLKTMMKYTHDMITTDDNIRIPLIFKYPGCKKGMKIKNVIGAVDIAPTICDILGIPKLNQRFKYSGRSFLKLMKGEKSEPTIVRTDTRLNLANGRVTSLRSDKYKYVYYWDQDMEELFNLADDQYETKNLLPPKSAKIKKTLSEFRKLNDDMEDDVNKFHVSVLHTNFISKMNKVFSSKKQQKVSRILITTKSAPNMIMECFLESAKKAFPNSKVGVLANKRDCKKYRSIGFDNFYPLKNLTITDVAGSPVIRNKYDIIFHLTESTREAFIDKNIIKIMKRLKKKRSFLLDYNFEIYSRFMASWIWPMRRYMNRNSKFYKEEPTLLLKDIYFLIKSGIDYKIKKERQSPIKAFEVKQARDKFLRVKTSSKK